MRVCTAEKLTDNGESTEDREIVHDSINHNWNISKPSLFGICNNPDVENHHSFVLLFARRPTLSFINVLGQIILGCKIGDDHFQ